MLFSTAVIATIPLLVGSVAANPVPRDTPSDSSSCANINYTSTEYQRHVIDEYFNLWSTGNYSNINKVVSEDFSFNQDRLPGENGTGTRVVPLHNITDLVAWIDHSRGGYSQFLIKKRYWIGNGYTIMVRWYLDAVIQNLTTHAPPSDKLPPGSPIVYNGTDTYFINPCTGLIDEIDSAQDFITFFAALGLTSIPV